MTSTSWDSLSYYGRKLKRNFSIIDAVITHVSKEAAVKNDKGKLSHYNFTEEGLEMLLKMMARQEHMAHTVTKMMNQMDLTKRLEDIERIIEAISPEALQEAKISIGN